MVLDLSAPHNLEARCQAIAISALAEMEPFFQEEGGITNVFAGLALFLDPPDDSDSCIEE